VKELAITEGQTKEFAALGEAFRKDAAAVLESATQSAVAGKKLDAMIAARRKKAEGVLTADQTARGNELVGEPFTGHTRPDRLPVGFGGDLAVRAETFGRYSLAEFRFLATNTDIQKELKLNEKQIAKAAEIQGKIQDETLPNPADAVAREKNFAA